MVDFVCSVVVIGSGKGIGWVIVECFIVDGWMVVGFECLFGLGIVEEGIVVEVVFGDVLECMVYECVVVVVCVRVLFVGWVNNVGIMKCILLYDLDEIVVWEVIDINGFGYIWGCLVVVFVFVD